MAIFSINNHNLIKPLNLERELGSEFEWLATTGDPQLGIANAEKLAGRWVRLCMTIKTEGVVLSPVVIYEDSGHGFTEATAHHLMANRQGNIDFSWRLPADLRALRIDPVAEATRFSIPKFQLRPTTRVVLVCMSAWRVLTQYPGGFQTKMSSAIRLFKTAGLKVTLTRLVAANNEFARNATLAHADSRELLRMQRLQNPERLDILESYVQAGFLRSNSKITWQSCFVPKAPDPVNLNNLPVKIVAFYLPQFHPFAENDAWWGKGFTEWTNVSKAQPQYVGHHQPRLPGELGFYDLRLPEVMRQQIDLAHHYGVTGFCFHHYWFGGKRLMERPVNQLLANPSLNIDFCLCWANENWTRRWDGADHDVLIAQKHSADDDIAFFVDILPALRDPRYICVDGKPFLIVYRVALLPDAAATAARWRKQALQSGLPGLYLVAARTHDMTDPRPYGFDATVEFPPHQVPASDITHKKTIVNPGFEGKIYDFKDFSDKFGRLVETRFTNYKTVMPSWDNEARKPGKGFIFDGAEPDVYAQWLTSAAKLTQNNKPDERLLFINAWNEWAEGAHLEPDRHLGYAYLHATANVLRNLADSDVANDVSELNRAFVKSKNTVVVMHLYYEDLIDAIFPTWIAPLASQADLIVTVRPDITAASLLRIKALFDNVLFIRTANQGRDIRPFLEAFQSVSHLGYEFLCKLHSKKSPHRQDGAQWRDELFASLIRSPKHVRSVLEKFNANPQLGLLVPSGCMTDLSDEPVNIDNRSWLNVLFHRMGVEHLENTYSTYFPAGSMYWGRVSALSLLLDTTVFNPDEFELEAGQLDGTLAHAVERVMGLVTHDGGFSIEQIK